MSNRDKKKRKQPAVKRNPDPKKIPVTNNNPSSTNTENPVWLFSKCDCEHPKWSIKHCDTIWDDIISRLSALEGQTWQEILTTSGGRRSGTNNHPISVRDIVPEAQKRFVEMKLDRGGWDEVFSLRFNGTKRIYGVRQGAKFYVLWYDPDHEICPSKKRNT